MSKKAASSTKSKEGDKEVKEYTATYVSAGGTRELSFDRVGDSVASNPDEELQEATCHAKNCCRAGETLQSVRRNK